MYRDAQGHCHKKNGQFTTCRAGAKRKKAASKTPRKRVIQWSGKVKVRWHAPPGFFSRSPRAIARGLMEAHKNYRSAMSSLNFAINRAGKNLSREQKARLNEAKRILMTVYGPGSHHYQLAA